MEPIERPKPRTGSLEEGKEKENVHPDVETPVEVGKWEAS
jgi:hypothetical protein